MEIEKREDLKHGKVRQKKNIFIIFLVSGFWHGANWNFIVWGGIHACGFLPLLLLNRNRKYVSNIVAADRKLPSIKELYQMILTFGFVTFAWIFFRIHSISTGLNVVKRIILNSLNKPGQFLHPGKYMFTPGDNYAFYYIIPFVIMDWHFRRDERSLKISKIPNTGRIIIYNLMILIILYFSVNQSHQQFIYFQF